MKDSNDSRHYGPVPASHILGRVVCKVSKLLTGLMTKQVSKCLMMMLVVLN